MALDHVLNMLSELAFCIPLSHNGLIATEYADETNHIRCAGLPAAFIIRISRDTV